MINEIDWDALEDVPQTSKEVQLSIVVSKKPSDNALFSLFDLFSDKWGVEFTNKNVIVYNDTNLSEEVREIKVKKIKALYINSERNQLLLKLKSPLNEIVYTGKAVECAKAVLAARKGEFIPVYDLPVKSLEGFADEPQLPSSEFICNEIDNSSSRSDSEYSHPEAIEDQIHYKTSMKSSESESSGIRTTATASNHLGRLLDEGFLLNLPG